jgi:hypothetical protein
MRHFPLSIDTEGVAKERARALMGAALVLYSRGKVEERAGHFVFDREALVEIADDIETGESDGLRPEDPIVQADASSIKSVTLIPSPSG